MKCSNCGKNYKKGAHVLVGNRKQPVHFCCYDCYIKFWKEVPGFEPSPNADKTI